MAEIQAIEEKIDVIMHLRPSSQIVASNVDKKELQLIERYWRAANYLSVGQIYLLKNPLLNEPLKPEHCKIRLVSQVKTVTKSLFL